jgi:alpha-acetolactate decarboxylase
MVGAHARLLVTVAQATNLVANATIVRYVPGMRYRALGAVFFLVACSRDDAMPPPAPAVSVEHQGKLSAIFGGDWSASASLDTTLSADSYALGALSDLRGEFAVIAGDVWLSYPTATTLPEVQHPSHSNEQAALLVMSDVRAWQETVFSEDVGASGFESELTRIAGVAGVDTSKPFPFLIRGKLRNVGWHVADGTRVKPGDPPDKDAQQGMIAEGEGTIVGFYSTKDQGVFTMMGQNTHMHVVLTDESVVGHVRTVDVATSAVLSVPASR